MIHTIRNGVSWRNFPSYKNKSSTDFMTKTFIEKEKMRERKEIRKLQNIKKDNVNFTELFSNNTNKFYSPPVNVIKTSQSKKCRNICSENGINSLKLKVVKKPIDQSEDLKNISKRLKHLQLQIQKDEISINEQITFEKKRQQEIAEMVKDMFDETNKYRYVNAKRLKLKAFTFKNKRHCKTIIGRGKFIIKTKIENDTINKWRINMNELTDIKNMIFGVQVVDRNNKKNTIYSNETGMIFYDRKYVKHGLKIKNRSQFQMGVIISIKYTNYGEIMVDFSYLKRGKLVNISCNNAIIIDTLNGFDYGVNAKIFVAQNNGHGRYEIVQQITN